jgi:hypothetical protein
MSQATFIRISITKEVSETLKIAKKRYPTLSDPEIMKLGLSSIVTENQIENSYNSVQNEIRQAAARAVGYDYLTDDTEDIYTASNGKKVSF